MIITYITSVGWPEAPFQVVHTTPYINTSQWLLGQMTARSCTGSARAQYERCIIALAALHVAHIAVIELLEFLNLIYRRYMVGYMTLFLFF